MAGLDVVLDELYTARPADFVALRDGHVRALRAAGDTGAAREVSALRRPTHAAWLLNLLARRRPGVLDDLIALGAALREAQQAMDGASLRALTGQRRALVGALVVDAVRLGEESGAPTGSAARAEVEATLEAALADPGTGVELRRGCLTRAVERSGDLAGWGQPPPGEPTPGEPPPGEPPLRRAEEALRRAEEARDAAAREATLATVAVEELAGRLRELQERVVDVQRRLAEATLEARRRAAAVDRAEASVATARRVAERARR